MVGGVLTVDSLVITNTCGGIFNRTGGMLEYLQLVLAPNGDADGDGVSNADELAAGSDPLSATSLPRPRLHFQRLNNQLVLSWTNARFNLQSVPTITGHFTNIPGATSPYTNSLSAPQQFFRLIGN